MLVTPRYTKYLLLGIIVSSLFSLGIFPHSASALSGSQFRADRIIDDAIFYKGDSLTSDQVQSFLNAKMPSCDTQGSIGPFYDRNGTRWNTRADYGRSKGVPPPYTCLKDYRQDHGAKSDSGLCNAISPKANRSAAQIIDDVSRACNVNQKALIVMLQKEQSLVTDDWPWPTQYVKAMGYYCPDDPNNPGWCHPEYAGFFNQVYNAALQLIRYKLYPQDYNHALGRTSFVSYQANAPQCGGTNIYMKTAATAGLYNYTPYQPNPAALNNLYGTGDSCSAYGNRNFWRMYNDWFGGTLQQPNDCDSKVSGVICVWSIMKTDGSQFLTSSKAERDLTLNSYGWIYEGVALYATQTQQSGTIPTYRLRQNGTHLFTADQSEYISLKNSGNWADEGVAFYTYPGSTSTNVSHKVYRLYSSSQNRRYWTLDENKRIALLGQGYTLESSSFSGFSGLANLPLPPSSRINVYRLQGPSGYFYTTSLGELETVINMGYSYEEVLSTSSSAISGTPVYRLQRNGSYFYTSDQNERNTAIQTYGMTSEGIGFYLDNDSSQVYRMSNTMSNNYLYTSNINEVMLAVNTNGWRYEGELLARNTTLSPAYRFLNVYNGRHFYTININEAALVANRNWKYEGIVFNVSKDTGTPVYRLRINDRYLFTVSASEKDNAVSRYGYSYEGVAYYSSQTATNKPVYRLQGNSEYFYTMSSPERDTAVSKYGYQYEGEAFYLVP